MVLPILTVTADSDIDEKVEEQKVNRPPNTPTIIGETNVVLHKKYEYKFFTNDPDGDAVCYNVDWGRKGSEKISLKSV